MLTIEAHAELITDLTADRNRYADSGQAELVAEYNRAITLEQAKLAHTLGEQSCTCNSLTLEHRRAAHRY